MNFLFEDAHDLIFVNPLVIELRCAYARWVISRTSEKMLEFELRMKQTLDGRFKSPLRTRRQVLPIQHIFDVSEFGIDNSSFAIELIR